MRFRCQVVIATLKNKKRKKNVVIQWKAYPNIFIIDIYRNSVINRLRHFRVSIRSDSIALTFVNSTLFLRLSRYLYLRVQSINTQSPIGYKSSPLKINIEKYPNTIRQVNSRCTKPSLYLCIHEPVQKLLNLSSLQVYRF